jgi:hypothetical protein
MTPKPETFTAYITQYALTVGVFKQEVEQCDSPTMVASTRRGVCMVCYHKPHWHRTEAEALWQFYKMRDRALRSTEKKLDKLTKLKFAVKD